MFDNFVDAKAHAQLTNTNKVPNYPAEVASIRNIGTKSSSRCLWHRKSGFPEARQHLTLGTPTEPHSDLVDRKGPRHPLER